MQQIELKNGKRYRGSIVVDHMGMGVSSNRVKEAFEGIGFSDVVMWDDWETLPTDWTEEDKKELDLFLEKSQFWAEGNWGGQDQIAVTEGDNWQIAWIRQLDAPDPGFQQQVSKSSKYAWLIPTTAIAVFAMATGLWIKGSSR